MADNAQEIERRLGEAYAQNLKEKPASTEAYRDCKEVIQSSLGILEHYNKISLAMKGVFQADQLVPARVTVQGN